MPLIIRRSDVTLSRDSVDAISTLHSDMRRALRTCGAIVSRDFEINTVREFKRIVEKFSQGQLMDYAGGASPRTALSKGVYTSTEYPPEMPLALHNELSYSAEFPRTLFFL